MSNGHVIHERLLLDRLRCPMRRGTVAQAVDSMLVLPIEDVARWYFREFYEGKEPSHRDIRCRVEAQLDYRQFEKSAGGLPPDAAFRRLSAIPRIARRLRDLTVTYELINPVTPYELEIGEEVIKGEFAVLRSPRKKMEAVILYLRDVGVARTPVVPDIISYARFLELTRRDAGFDSISILHYWVTSYHALMDHPVLERAEAAVDGAIRTFIGPPYPVPGAHCSSCIRPGCQPDLYSGTAGFVDCIGG